jgi:hypothetical protein
MEVPDLNERPPLPCGRPADPAMEGPDLSERPPLPCGRPADPAMEVPPPPPHDARRWCAPGEKSALIDSGGFAVELTVLSAAKSPFIAHNGMAVRMTRR